MYLCTLTQATIKCAFLRDKKIDITIIIIIIRQPKLFLDLNNIIH